MILSSKNVSQFNKNICEFEYINDFQNIICEFEKVYDFEKRLLTWKKVIHELFYATQTREKLAGKPSKRKKHENKQND